MTTKLQELEAKQAKERENLLLQEAIASALPDLGIEPRIHAGIGCYGDKASISYGDTYGHGPAPSLDVALKLAEALPAMPLVQIRDGCLSFQTRSYYYALPESKRERVQEELEVCPWELKFDPSTNGTTLRLEWSTDLPGIGQVSVSVLLGKHCPSWLGSYSARRVEYKGGFRYENCSLSINHGKIGIIYRDGEPLAEVQHPVKWGRGGDEYQNNFTAFWIDYRNDRPCTVADFIRQVMAS